MKLSKSIDAKLGVQVSPLIDVVFLLLIYFMVTSTLIQKEADLSFTLPIVPVKSIELPIELVVEITGDGTIDLNGMRYHSNDRDLTGLAEHIRKMRFLATTQRSKFFVNIQPHDETLHRRIIDVMDVCAEAGVQNLGFSQAM